MAELATQLKELPLPELLEQYPSAKAVLEQYNLLAYSQTKAASLENLQASALVNQVNLDALLGDLSGAIKGEG
jgi:hypothetical protein